MKKCSTPSVQSVLRYCLIIVWEAPPSQIKVGVSFLVSGKYLVNLECLGQDRGLRLDVSGSREFGGITPNVVRI